MKYLTLISFVITWIIVLLVGFNQLFLLKTVKQEQINHLSQQIEIERINFFLSELNESK